MWDLKNWGRVLVSILVVAGFILVTLLYLTQKLSNSAVPEILAILLGALASNFTSVVSYWIGSSAGSSSKDAAIESLASKP